MKSSAHTSKHKLARNNYIWSIASTRQFLEIFIGFPTISTSPCSSILNSIAQRYNPRPPARTQFAMASQENGELRLLQLCTKESWWRVPHLIKLNLLLLVPFFSSYIGGFDGSMLNGVQTVSHWQECKARLLVCFAQTSTLTWIHRLRFPFRFPPRAASQHADDRWRCFSASRSLSCR